MVLVLVPIADAMMQTQTVYKQYYQLRLVATCENYKAVKRLYFFCNMLVAKQAEAHRSANVSAATDTDTQVHLHP